VYVLFTYSTLDYKILSVESRMSCFPNYLKKPPVSRMISLIKNILYANIEYVESSGIQDLKSRTFTLKINPLKRQRFLSEDISNPSYQILNFQNNMILEDDYMKRTQGSGNQSSNCLKQLDDREFHDIDNEQIAEREYKNYFNTKKLSSAKNFSNFKLNSKNSVEKENNSRKSTEMKSHVISNCKEDDDSMLEVSDNSYELTIEEGMYNKKLSLSNINENISSINNNTVISQLEILEDIDKQFNLKDIVDKVKMLKDVI
jgi:hypothetical protein